MIDADDIEAFLGLEPFVPVPKGKRVECGQEPPRAKPQTGVLWNNATSFVFGGYIARVTRYHCAMCENLWDQLEGIYTVEIHQASGTRRLTALGRGASWPAGEIHTKEVAEVEVLLCGSCIGGLGFSREVDSRGLPYTLIPGVGTCITTNGKPMQPSQISERAKSLGGILSTLQKRS